tara:strand:- start:125 stop:718 length:594 start_codon:yes stop_codon:yes gene_type:complete
MSRSIPSSLLSALIGDKIQPYFAVELMFDTRTDVDINGDVVDIGPLRMWTGLGDKTITVQGSSQVFTGTGSLLTIGDLEEVGDLSSKSVELTLSGIPTSIVSLALQEPYQRRPMRLYLGEQSDSSVVEIFSGKMDKMRISDEAESSTIALTVENKLIELERSSNWRYTNENHQSRYDGDSFFSYVQSLQDAQITWGR